LASVLKIPSPKHTLPGRPHPPKEGGWKPHDIAVVGSGIAGLSAAWLLQRHNNVTVYEANDYIGGHSHTVDVTVDGKSIPVDTGFIVFNPVNYPNLVALFDELQVPTTATDMSFSASMGNGGFEYAGGNGAGLFAQKLNVFRPRFWAMVRGILRFYKAAPELVQDPSIEGLSLGELLEREGYGPSFVKDHLAPMGAAIWSSNSEDILDYPALSFLRFFMNHGLTQLKDRPAWRTVTGGSREYVERLTAGFRGNIQLSKPVKLVRQQAVGVEVELENGGRQTFDHVVFACHSDQALKLMEKPLPQQQDVFSRLTYAPNKVVLHADETLMPQRKAAWASWNYIDDPKGGTPAVSYWMNRLQHLPVETPVIVTLNPNRPIDPAKVLGEFSYDHPVFDMAALEARREVWNLQGTGNMWFCGAYLGDGFHEDGIQSGLAVAEMLGGVARPWDIEGQNARLGLVDNLLDMVQTAQ
jgi:predicted NAD/FAD-binding protein